MAAVPLFRDINMAAVTSRENALYVSVVGNTGDWDDQDRLDGRMRRSSKIWSESFAITNNTRFFAYLT